MPLVSIQGNPNTHGGGELIADNPQTVTVENIPIIELVDPASPDALCPIPPHCNPASSSGSPNVFVYNNPIHRDQDSRICGAVTIVDSQTTVFANEPGENIDGIFLPENPYQTFYVKRIIQEAGNNAPHDDPDSEVIAYNTPADSIPGSVDESKPADVTPATEDEGQPTDCGDFETNPIDYNQKLSPNFSIKNLSIGAVFAHNIVAQNGLSTADIICNLKGLAENILEPLNSEYPGFRVNSGFRKGTSTSQHNRGMSCDLQWPGLSPAGYTPIAIWIRDNLPFDQLIFEHGNSIWLHISYNRTIDKQRNQLLTYYPSVIPNYKPGLTNYYA
jgi:uncharacterized Zn-binding protein involved in type VI secretion